MSDSQQELIPTRRSLLSRLRDWDDQESWREFFDTYWRLIYSVALKAGLDEAEAQDVVQETVLSAARKLPGFRYDPAQGSFKNWLLLITRRRIADQLRRKYRRPETVSPAPTTPAATDMLDRLPDPREPDLEAAWNLEWERHLLEHALRQVKQQVDARQYQIFDCYVLKQWEVKDVVRALGVSAGQVYLAKHRVGALLAKAVQQLEQSGRAG